MMIPLRRQEEITWHLEDAVEYVLTKYFLWERITFEEKEWMLQLLSKLLTLPNLSKTKENVAMSHNALVVKEANKLIDDEFLKIAAGERDGYLAYAYAEGGTVTFGNLTNAESSNNDVTIDVKETSEDKKDIKIHLLFASEVSTEESKQPFETLTDDESRPLCVSFIEGSAQDFGDVESTHSVEWRAHQHYLVPKVLKIYNSHKQDLEETVKELNQLFTKNEISSSVFPGNDKDTRGEILILFQDGQTVSITKGDKHKRYEWGETSLAFGYEAKAINPEKTAAVKSGLTGNKNKTSVPEVKKPDTAISSAMDKAKDNKTNLGIIIVPPAHIFNSHQSLEGWYRGYTDPVNMPSTEELHSMKGHPEKAIPVPCKSSWNNAALNGMLKTNKFLLAPDGVKPKAEIDKPKEVTVPAMIISKTDLEKMKTITDKIMKAKNEPGTVLIYKPEEVAAAYKAAKLLKPTDQLGLSGLEAFEGWYEAWQLVPPEVCRMLLAQFSHEHSMAKKVLADAAKLAKAI